MKLFYNPSFTGNTYIDFKKSPVLFDAKIVNTAGLCGIIRLHAGICSEVKDYGERFVDYYAAMKKFMAKNPKNILSESFKIDSLNVLNGVTLLPLPAGQSLPQPQQNA